MTRLQHRNLASPQTNFVAQTKRRRQSRMRLFLSFGYGLLPTGSDADGGASERSFAVGCVSLRVENQTGAVQLVSRGASASKQLASNCQAVPFQANPRGARSADEFRPTADAASPDPHRVRDLSPIGIGVETKSVPPPAGRPRQRRKVCSLRTDAVRVG